MNKENIPGSLTRRGFLGWVGSALAMLGLTSLAGAATLKPGDTERKPERDESYQVRSLGFPH